MYNRALVDNSTLEPARSRRVSVMSAARCPRHEIQTLRLTCRGVFNTNGRDINISFSVPVAVICRYLSGRPVNAVRHEATVLSRVLHGRGIETIDRAGSERTRAACCPCEVCAWQGLGA